MRKVLNLETELRKATREVARLLTRREKKLVLAESCTGGLLASLFTEIPGISNHFCGSFVVYRLDSKQKWLGVSARTLRNRTAVSREVAEEMARGALRRTLEADIAAAVTGNLGPTGEPVGRVFITVLKRGGTVKLAVPVTLELDIEPLSASHSATLLKKPEGNQSSGLKRGKPDSARLERRNLAALAVLFLVRDSLKV